MKIYRDSKLLGEASEIDFGIVEVGTTKELVLYLKNDTTALLTNIIYELSSKEVELINPPKEVQPDDVAMLRLRWSPKIGVKKGLKVSISISGDEIYG